MIVKLEFIMIDLNIEKKNCSMQLLLGDLLGKRKTIAFKVTFLNWSTASILQRLLFNIKSTNKSRKRKEKSAESENETKKKMEKWGISNELQLFRMSLCVNCAI